MSTLVETLEAAARPRSSRTTRATAATAPEPQPVETPCPPTPPPNENPSYLAACDRLEQLVKQRLDVEQRLERTEARALRHGPVPAIVGARAAAAFRGEAIDYEPVPDVARLREDVAVARLAENLARERRGDVKKSVCRQIAEETREHFHDLVRASYTAFTRFIQAEEAIDAFEQTLAAGGAFDVHHRQRPHLMGVVLNRNVLCNVFDQLTAYPDNPLTGEPRPNTPNPTE